MLKRVLNNQKSTTKKLLYSYQSRSYIGSTKLSVKGAAKLTPWLLGAVTAALITGMSTSYNTGQTKTASLA